MQKDIIQFMDAAHVSSLLVTLSTNMEVLVWRSVKNHLKGVWTKASAYAPCIFSCSRSKHIFLGDRCKTSQLY